MRRKAFYSIFLCLIFLSFINWASANSNCQMECVNNCIVESNDTCLEGTWEPIGFIYDNSIILWENLDPRTMPTHPLAYQNYKLIFNCEGDFIFERPSLENEASSVVTFIGEYNIMDTYLILTLGDNDDYEKLLLKYSGEQIIWDISSSIQIVFEKNI